MVFGMSVLFFGLACADAGAPVRAAVPPLGGARGQAAATVRRQHEQQIASHLPPYAVRVVCTTVSELGLGF